jgi:tRNA modification GTPase
LRSIFRRAPRARGEADFVPRRLEHGWVLDAGGAALDEVLAVFMPGPHTFTGEDTAEIHCHGGVAVLEAVLESVLSRGAGAAGPGEFTRRAFLNGRLDLSRAEAVAEMIAAPTLQGVFLARNKLAGGLDAPLEELRRLLDELRAALCLNIDFPDEAAAEHTEEEAFFLQRLGDLRAGIQALLSICARARLWREGALAVLTGRVNAGKSSLFNALLGRKRALVSPAPGTTRDFLEESLNLNGLPLRLADTAGLRLAGDAAADEVERQGLEGTREMLLQADLILLLLDASGGTESIPAAPEEELATLLQDRRVFVVLSKTDLAPPALWPQELWGRPAQAVSARTGQGLEELCRRLSPCLNGSAGDLDFQQVAPPSLRQKNLLTPALEELDALAREYAEGLPAELLSARLDSAAALLEDVIGFSGAEELLDKVFSTFCVGK